MILKFIGGKLVLAIGCIGELPSQIPSNFELPKFTKFKFHANLSPKGSLIFIQILSQI
jgi:hypothetical protein